MTYLEDTTETRQKRTHTMATGLSSMVLQIRKESIKQSLSDFNTIGHRQEYIGTIDGVMYYDDSRAENVNATWFTFENIVSPVIWIAGGNNNGSDFKELKGIAKKKVKAMICVGSNNSKLKKALQKDIKEIYEADDLIAAVKAAAILAKEDDIVLFSPACKSENSDETFVDRGIIFTETVKQLENELHQ